MIALRSGVFLYTAILLLACGSLLAQGPDIGRNGVFNAAAATPLVLSREEIARGALVTVTGVRFGSTVAGASIRLAGAWGDMPLTVVSVAPTRIEARIPLAVPPGAASLTITVAGKKSRAVPVHVVGSQFGLFGANGNGAGPGRIDNLSPAGGRTANSASHSAAPGQTVVLAGTGLGNSTAPSAFIAGQRAALLSVHKGTEGSRADEIAVRVPNDAPEGCFVPVQVRNAGRFPSNMVTLAIHRSGGACLPPEAIPFARWSGTRYGFLAVARTVSHNLDGSAGSGSDEAGATFAHLPPVANLTAFFLPPPPGNCVSRVETAGDTIPAANPFLDLLLSGGSEGPLSAGAELAINDGQIQQKIRPVQGAAAVYYSKFSARGPGGLARVLPHFLAPAQLHISGTGGDAGSFRAVLPGPEPFAVASPTSAIDRARGATLHWDPLGADRFAIVVLLFTDPVTFTTGSCYCVAAPGATAMTLPPEALANFPVVAPVYGGAQSFVTVISWPLHPVPFAAPGLDHGLAISAFIHTWEVILR